MIIVNPKHEYAYTFPVYDSWDSAADALRAMGYSQGLINNNIMKKVRKIAETFGYSLNMPVQIETGGHVIEFIPINREYNVSVYYGNPETGRVDRWVLFLR